jgi:hypothetical protein
MLKNLKHTLIIQLHHGGDDGCGAQNMSRKVVTDLHEEK